jgi:hypothetical protein
MSPEERMIIALRSARPGEALRLLVSDFAREGRSKADIGELLETFLVRHRDGPEYRDADEEVVLDVLDALRGWCHPDAELVAEQPEE